MLMENLSWLQFHSYNQNYNSSNVPLTETANKWFVSRYYLKNLEFLICDIRYTKFVLPSQVVEKNAVGGAIYWIYLQWRAKKLKKGQVIFNYFDHHLDHQNTFKSFVNILYYSACNFVRKVFHQKWLFENFCFNVCFQKIQNICE